MDEKLKLSTQIDSHAGPVILINKFNVEPDQVDQFLKQWAVDSAIRNHFCTDSSWNCGLLCIPNYAVWESTEHFKHAFNNPEFQSSIKGSPESTTASPHLFK